MRMTTLARRYTGALFEAAQAANVVDKVESDLGLITYSFQTMSNLRDALLHPLVPTDRKKQIVGEVFRSEIEQVTLDFLNLLIDKRRVDILEDVEQEYVHLANEFRGVVTVVVTSAVPLDPSERNMLQTRLEKVTGKTVQLSLEEDPDLVGGLIVRIGDTVIDGSVRGYLAALKDKLLGRE